MPTVSDSFPAAENAAVRVLGIIEQLVAETHPGRRRSVSLESQLERDLGLDSLARVELVLRLGRAFDTVLPDQALAEAQTPADLLSFLGQPSAVRAAAPAALGAHGEIEWPDEAGSLVEVLEHYAGRAPERTHVLLYGEAEQTEAVSYGALLREAQGIAAGLVSRGLQPRETVALMLPTGRAYLASFYAVMLVGAIPVPIYPPARLSQIEDHLRRHAAILRNAEARFLITVPEAKPVALMLRAAVPSLMGSETPEELAEAPTPLLYRASAGDIAFLQYTSGSTGDPKGVALTHGNLLANVRAMGQVAAVTTDDVFVSWLPLYHDMGLIGAWLGSLYHAFPLVLMSPLAFLARPARWLQAISRHRGTLSAAPNFAYELCAAKLDPRDLEGVDLSSWRLAFNGAEPVSPATLRAFTERFAPYGLQRTTLTPVYGLAECSVGLAFPPLGRGPKIDRIRREAFERGEARPAAPDDPSALELPACGRSLPGHEMRVVDEAGVELPERRVGHLQFRGPSATSGYYRNPEATRRLVQGEWLDSGDYAYLEGGEVYLTGRSKDLIIRGGRNIYPYELELAVGDLPGVRKGCVAVFASTDAASGTERIVVLAETRETEQAAREALKSRINGAALDVIGMPADEVVLAPPYTVLKTSSGKIRRAACREIYEKGAIGAVAPPRWRIVAGLFIGAGIARLRFAWARARRGLYAAYVWLVFVVLGLPVSLAVIAARPPALARRIARAGSRLFFLLIGLPVEVRRLSRLPSGAYVLLVNHASYLDAVLLIALLPPDHVFVAKREFVDQPFLHAFLRSLGTLFVERFQAGKGAEDVEQMTEALRRGAKVVVFPEGTFSREAGLKPFRMGAFVAAARAGVPIAVGGLRGMRDILRDNTWAVRYGRAEFEVGEVLAVSGPEWADATALRGRARAALLPLCGEHDLDA